MYNVNADTGKRTHGTRSILTTVESCMSLLPTPFIGMDGVERQEHDG